MSDEVPTADASSASRWSALPTWARVGIIAGIVIVIVIVSLFAWRLATRVPNIPLGETPAADLQPGSCLAESDLDLDSYTVVPCTEPHPTQVFAVADAELDDAIYALSGGALRTFVDEICERHKEYKLYLVEDLDRGDHVALGIDVPTPEEYESGEYDARCVIQAEDGSDLTRDLYRPLP